MSKVQELEKQIQQLQVEIEKLKEAEKNNKQWQPKYKNVYYFLTSAGTVSMDRWLDNQLDTERLFIGNIYRTEEKAKFEEEKLKVISELERYAKEFVKGEDNCYIYFDFTLQKSFYSYDCNIKKSMLYFSSKEIAMQAVEAIGEERIKKYYFGIEDEKEN